MPWTTPPGSGATVYVWNGYSLAERDRRWNAVRAGAATAGLAGEEQTDQDGSLEST